MATCEKFLKGLVAVGSDAKSCHYWKELRPSLVKRRGLHVASAVEASVYPNFDDNPQAIFCSTEHLDHIREPLGIMLGTRFHWPVPAAAAGFPCAPPESRGPRGGGPMP